MNRSDFLDALRATAPALAGKDFIPIFACFCFDGKTVTAYDDVVALSAKCPIPINGGVRGSVLLGWLNACLAKSIEVEETEANVILKGGRSKLEFALLPPDDFIFEWPEEEGVAVTKKADLDAIIEGIKIAAISMGVDPSQVSRLGITVTAGKKNLTLYSGRATTISKVTVPVTVDKAMLGQSIIIPPRFCELVLSLAGKGLSSLIFGDGWIEARTAAGLRLFSRTLADADPEIFESLFEAVGYEEIDNALMPIPKGFARALDRALVVLSTSKERDARLSSSGGNVILEAQSAAGKLRDRLKVEAEGDFDVRFYPEDLKATISHITGFAVFDRQCIACAGDGFYRLISVAGE